MDDAHDSALDLRWLPRSFPPEARAAPARPPRADPAGKVRLFVQNPWLHVLFWLHVFVPPPATSRKRVTLTARTLRGIGRSER
jgi:hypothetical protein